MPFGLQGIILSAHRLLGNLGFYKEIIHFMKLFEQNILIIFIFVTNFNSSSSSREWRHQFAAGRG